MHFFFESGDVFVVYCKDKGSRDLPANSLYNTRLTSIEKHPVLFALSKKKRVMSINDRFHSYQVEHLKENAKWFLSRFWGILKTVYDKFSFKFIDRLEKVMEDFFFKVNPRVEAWLFALPGKACTFFSISYDVIIKVWYYCIKFCRDWTICLNNKVHIYDLKDMIY